MAQTATCEHWPTGQPADGCRWCVTECAPYVRHHPGTRYPYVPGCSCGWHFRGYVAEHAAQTIADAHRDGDPAVSLHP
jgi:hypothetical protein